jgi:hypothetical protein
VVKSASSMMAALSGASASSTARSAKPAATATIGGAPKRQKAGGAESSGKKRKAQPLGASADSSFGTPSKRMCAAASAAASTVGTRAGTALTIGSVIGGDPGSASSPKSVGHGGASQAGSSAPLAGEQSVVRLGGVRGLSKIVTVQEIMNGYSAGRELGAAFNFSCESMAVFFFAS